jgi:RNA polymerase sigma factor (sigma-70 family)
LEANVPPEGVEEGEQLPSTPSDADSFAKFHHKHYAPLRAWLRARVDEPAAAEDLLAETIMILWQRWSKLGGPRDEADGFPRMRSFAYKTAQNKVFELWRKSQRSFSVEHFDPDAVMFSSLSSPSSHAEMYETLEVIGKLPEQQRRAMAMRVFGFENWEVAEALGVGEGTVRTHLAIARRKLIDYLRSCVGPVDEVTAAEALPSRAR